MSVTVLGMDQRNGMEGYIVYIMKLARGVPQALIKHSLSQFKCTARRALFKRTH